MSSSALKPASCKLREIYVETESESFDLHNNFDFVGFTYDTAERTVSLRWVSGEDTPAEERHALVVQMQWCRCVAFRICHPRRETLSCRSPKIHASIVLVAFHRLLPH